MKKLPLIMLLLLAFWATWPLFKAGFIPTHDGEYHLIRFWQFDKNLKKLRLFPRWAQDLDHGFGVPLFSFFYPLPNYLAEIFHLLGFSFIDSFKLSLALAFILSGTFFYFWVKEVFRPWPALMASVFYLYAPYHFLDLYVRGSIGEVWALAWLPAILWAIEKKSFVLTSLFFAFLILSHNILALIFSVFLLSYLVARQFFYRPTSEEGIRPPSEEGLLHATGHTLFAIILGLGLSCYFWLPALGESKYVTGLKLINFSDHFPALFQLIFPSWGTGFSVPGILDELSFQIGLDHLLVVGLALLLALRRRKKLAAFFLSWFFVLVFFSLEVSLPFWRLIPLMPYCQYPWRLLSLIILITSFLAGWVAEQLKTKALIFFFIIVAVFINWQYSRPVIYQPRQDSFYLENPTWTQGTATLGNSFNTIWAKEHPHFDQKLEVLEEEGKMRVNTNYFPGWQVFVDGQKTKISLEEDGAFNFALPEAHQKIKIEFKETPLRLLADAISIFSFLILVVKVVRY